MSTSSTLERWKVLVAGLAEEHGLRTRDNDFYTLFKNKLKGDPAPDVRNLKVKKIKYKNKELAEENIRKGKERMEMQRRQETDRESQD